MTRHVFALGSLFAACFYPPLERTGLACDEEHPCGSGLRCVAEQCVSASGVEVDGGERDAGTNVPFDGGSRCAEWFGTTDFCVDFDDRLPGSGWVQKPPAMATVVTYPDPAAPTGALSIEVGRGGQYQGSSPIFALGGAFPFNRVESTISFVLGRSTPAFDFLRLNLGDAHVVTASYAGAGRGVLTERWSDGGTVSYTTDLDLQTNGGSVWVTVVADVRGDGGLWVGHAAFWDLPDGGRPPMNLPMRGRGWSTVSFDFGVLSSEGGALTLDLATVTRTR